MPLPLLLAAALLSDCSGMDRWPAMMTLSRLNDAGVIRLEEVDFAKSSSVAFTSQRLPHGELRQVFLVTIVLRDGRRKQAITINDASREECSLEPPTVFRVQQLPPLPGEHSGPGKQ